MVEQQYRALGRRLVAFVFDLFVLYLVLGIPDALLRSYLHSPILGGIWGFVMAWALVVYRILMHGFWGQTIGKMATRVKVYDKSGQPLSMQKAVLREIVPILERLLLLMLLLFPLLGYSELPFNEIPAPTWLPNWASGWLSIGTVWYLLNGVVALLNRRRRAIHDFIAGSVVLREESEGALRTEAKIGKIVGYGLGALIALGLLAFCVYMLLMVLGGGQ
jgi:uncharacterized RDD family membrane protein YckC